MPSRLDTLAHQLLRWIEQVFQYQQGKLLELWEEAAREKARSPKLFRACMPFQKASCGLIEWMQEK